MSENLRENWSSYLRHMMAERSQAEFAKTIDVTDGQLSKWLSGSTGVTAEKVISIARMLHDSPVHALGRVGWISASELTAFTVPREFGLDEFSDRELAMEIVRRIDEGEASADLTEPIEPPADLAKRRSRKLNVPKPQHDVQEVAFESDVDHDADTDDLYE